MKKFFTLIVILLLFICSCEKKKSTDKIEIDFWHVLGGPFAKVLDPMIAEFNRTHPNIHIRSVSMGRYQALSQKLMASIVAGNPPALSQAFESWTSMLIDAGVIVPMQDFIDGPNGLSKEELDDIIPVFKADNTWDGKIWSFPFNKSVRALYYNKDMFAEVGLDPDKPPADWNEFIEYSKKLARDTNGDGEPDIWATAFPVDLWMFGNALLANGGSLLSPDGKRCMFNQPEGIEVMQYFYNMLNNPKVAYLATGYEYQNDFLAGKVAMMEGSTVSVIFIRDKLRFKLGLAPIPGKRIEKKVGDTITVHINRGMLMSGTNVVISSKVPKEQQEAAWKFVKWFTNTENTTEWAIGTFYVPIRYSAIESQAMQMHFNRYPGLKEVIAQLNYTTFEPRTQEWFIGRRLLEETALEAILRGNAPIKETLDKTAKEIDIKLNR